MSTSGNLENTGKHRRDETSPLINISWQRRSCASPAGATVERTDSLRWPPLQDSRQYSPEATPPSLPSQRLSLVGVGEVLESGRFCLTQDSPNWREDSFTVLLKRSVNFSVFFHNIKCFGLSGHPTNIVPMIHYLDDIMLNGQVEQKVTNMQRGFGKTTMLHRVGDKP